MGVRRRRVANRSGAVVKRGRFSRCNFWGHHAWKSEKCKKSEKRTESWANSGCFERYSQTQVGVSLGVHEPSA